MKLVLDINNETQEILPKKSIILKTIIKVLEKKQMEGDYSLGLNVVSSEKIKILNNRFRKINAPTDVLSFPIYKRVPKNQMTSILLGDIIICYEVMRCNAIRQGMTTQEEFLNLVGHSILHLLGYHHR